MLSPTPNVVFGRSDFDLIGELVVADPISGCEIPTNNATNKIIAFQFEDCLTDIIMKNSIAANALVSDFVFNKFAHIAPIEL